MLLPNSTIVMKDLRKLYDEKVSGNKMFTGELLNRSDSNAHSRFGPSSKVLGCVKGCDKMKELSEHLEILISRDNTDQPNFEGNISRYLRKLMSQGKCNIICGKGLGTKNKENKVILVDHLLEESSLNLCMCSLYCIILPDDDILNRTKYQWFARLSPRQVLEANTQASKFMLISHGK